MTATKDLEIFHLKKRLRRLRLCRKKELDKMNDARGKLARFVGVANEVNPRLLRVNCNIDKVEARLRKLDPNFK